MRKESSQTQPAAGDSISRTAWRGVLRRWSVAELIARAVVTPTAEGMSRC